MLDVQGVEKRFRSGADEVLALAGIDLHLDRGDFLTVIGSNGAGKSTLLHVICGVLLPTTGRVRLGGVDVTCTPAYRRARRISRIVQDPMKGTAPSMTVAENLALASKRCGRTLRPAISRRRRAAFVGRLSDLGVDLTTRLDDPVSTLSGGERQALAVAMATLSRPDLLLLDEHTAALDPKNAERIVELTRAFVEESCLTTIMVTHNMDQAIELGNRLAMMHKGQFVHEVRDEAKRRARVCDLVLLFSRRHVADDELLLDPA